MPSVSTSCVALMSPEEGETAVCECFLVLNMSDVLANRIDVLLECASLHFFSEQLYDCTL